MSWTGEGYTTGHSCNVFVSISIVVLGRCADWAEVDVTEGVLQVLLARMQWHYTTRKMSPCMTCSFECS